MAPNSSLGPPRWVGDAATNFLRRALKPCTSGPARDPEPRTADEAGCWPSCLSAAKDVVVGALAGGLPCGTAGATLRPVTLWQLFRRRKLVRARRHGACARWPPGHTVNRVAVLYSADIPVMPGFNVEWAFITKTTHGSPCSRFFRIACPCPNASANAVEVGNEAELPVQGPISLPSHRRARRCQQSGKSRGRLPRHRLRPRGRRLRLRGRNSTVMWAGISS